MKNMRQHPITLQQRITTLENRIELLSKLHDLNIAERIENLENRSFESKSLFTLEEASVFLGISRALLYKMTSKMMIPHFKPRGKMVYFEKEELIAWVRQGSVAASPRTVTLDDIRNLCNELKL